MGSSGFVKKTTSLLDLGSDGTYCVQGSYRERFSPRVRQNANGTSSNFHIQDPNNSLNSEYAGVTNQPTGLNSNHGEVALINQRNTSLDHSLPSTSNEEVQEEEEEEEEAGGSLDHARQERTTINANLHEWDDENLIVIEEPQINSPGREEHADRSWIATSQPHQRGWEVRRQPIGHNLLQNNSDNIELRELLERLQFFSRRLEKV